MLRIEFGNRTEFGPCDCCGGMTISLTRFVYQDEDAYAVYFARFSNNHPDQGAAVATISLGEWGEEETPDQRVAFALRIWTHESQYQVGLIDAAQSPWRNVAFIGRTLDRAEALAHPRLGEVFDITDHMVQEDTELKAYLDATSDT